MPPTAPAVYDHPGFLPGETVPRLSPIPLDPGCSRGRVRKARSRAERREVVLTGNPGHELQGSQDTHGPQGPQVHVCVEVGSRSGQDAADGDTEGQGYPGLALSPGPMAGSWVREDSAWKRTRPMPAACGRARAGKISVGPRGTPLATSGFHATRKEDGSSHQNPGSKP